MELRQLKYFIKAAELLNFTAAAEACFITQGTLSQQLKQLENDLNMLLFDRIGKRVKLTEAGKVFLPFAQHTVAASQQGKQALNDLQNLKTGELKIGATHALIPRLTPALIAFSEKFPGIIVSVEFGTSEVLLGQLEEGLIDFVLLLGKVSKPEQVVSYPLFTSQLSLIVKNTHPLAGRRKISFKDIVQVPLVLPGKGFHTRKFINKIIQQEQLKLDMRMELNDIHTLVNLVKTGKWATILTAATVSKQEGLKAIPIGGKDNVMKASLIWPKDAYRKKSAIELGKLLMEK
ncbi:LysR family transcriptional regulator, cyn operon transcriptional activator [Chitinophaga costaii]|uniref:LysR family transcriptional regulator, cyn operon transcriptional activator n=2 Tax=Chitinophaga costaii TaxID=1335309 RepID=A0A1C4EHL5_9BACT|nr:LysR family transcriptional regulator, cyn operon transcriptional activator [Chitinophaga costaii]